MWVLYFYIGGILNEIQKTIYERREESGKN